MFVGARRVGERVLRVWEILTGLRGLGRMSWWRGGHRQCRGGHVRGRWVGRGRDSLEVVSMRCDRRRRSVLTEGAWDASLSPGRHMRPRHASTQKASLHCDWWTALELRSACAAVHAPLLLHGTYVPAVSSLHCSCPRHHLLPVACPAVTHIRPTSGVEPNIQAGPVGC